MSLSTAIDISNSSLAATSQLTSIASRNIANAGNGDATRKSGNLVTGAGGGVHVAQVSRAFDTSLRDTLLGAAADAGRLTAIAASLDNLDVTGGGSDGLATPESRLSDLRAALQAYSFNTADQSLAYGVINAASDMAATLRQWANNTDQVRARADSDIRSAAQAINTLLKQITDVNAVVVKGALAGRDITDQLDARDTIVRNIAEQIGITAVAKPNNGIALYTDSGITLFDDVARTVTVQNLPLAGGGPGGAIIIDGVPAIGAGAVMPVLGGRLAGLAEIRDQIAPAFAAQLDDMAASLVRAFAEADQRVPASSPGLPGLFTSLGISAVPAAGSAPAGLAKALILNANADPRHGGSLLRLRDGGISAPGDSAYLYNPSGSTAFSGRVEELIGMLAQPALHHPATGLPAEATIFQFMAASAGWLQDQRQTHSQNSAYANTLLEKAQQALSAKSGVNLDAEMAQLLGLERTYQASAKLISTVQEMYAALMRAIG